MYNILNTRKNYIRFPRYQKLTTALYTWRSSSLLLSQLIALNVSYSTTKWNISQSTHTRNTHWYINNHERK